MEGYYTLLQENNNNQFTVDDLFDFSKEDEVMTDGFFDNFAGNCSDSSNVTAVDSCNSSVSGGETHFSGGTSFSGADQFNGEFCVPDDDVAELEWLSNFVDESSSDHSHIDPPHLSTPMCHVITTDTSSLMTRPDQPTFPCATSSFPGKARSKRSRAAPCDWSSRLLLLQNGPKSTQPRRRDIHDDPDRACLHCGSNKTPQWRAGPMGPKTLCNACGVRYKSGRLVPEYRPASSPSFVATKHSNSHRKVLELRRQNEVAVFRGSNGGDYNLMNGYHHNGPEYGHMI